MRLVVEGGDHRGAGARPFGDVAVVGIRSEVEAQGDSGLAQALGVAGAAMRVLPAVDPDPIWWPELTVYSACGQLWSTRLATFLA